LNGIQEVGGSIPPSSTKINPLGKPRGFFFIENLLPSVIMDPSPSERRARIRQKLEDGMKGISGPFRAVEMAATALGKVNDSETKEKLEKLRQKAARDQEAIDNVIQARKQARADRKGAARQKLDQIKQRIEMLKRMAVNSKSAARELARLARELKGAAREFRETAPASELTTSTTTPEAATAEREAEAKADKEFAAEVKKVAQLLKAMLRRRQPEDDEEKRGLEKAHKDLGTATDDADAITANADAISAGGAPGGGGLLV
jgi:hypothetical protein